MSCELSHNMHFVLFLKVNGNFRSTCCLQKYLKTVLRKAFVQRARVLAKYFEVFAFFWRTLLRWVEWGVQEGIVGCSCGTCSYVGQRQVEKERRKAGHWSCSSSASSLTLSHIINYRSFHLSNEHELLYDLSPVKILNNISFYCFASNLDLSNAISIIPNFQMIHLITYYILQYHFRW